MMALNGPEVVTPRQKRKQAVGIVSTSRTGLDEVGSQLARQGVGVSQAIGVASSDLDIDTGGEGMLAGLQALQNDPGTEVIILVSGQAAPEAARRVLACVRNSDKPTVICFVGVDRHLAWRAGAIPASRMDEGSMRAAAWVRGWDQALISSRLEDQDERLADQASGLAARVGPGRHRLEGLLTSGLFCHEAHLMLDDVTEQTPQAVLYDLGAEGTLSDQFQIMQQTLARADVALVLTDLGFELGEASCLKNALATVPQQHREGTLVIVHVCGQVQATERDLDRLEDLEASLREEGIIVASSNATAARLAGMILEAGTVPVASTVLGSP